MKIFETEQEKKSIVMTTLLFLVLFLLFFWLKFSNEVNIEMLEGGGGGGEVAVNFGDSEMGSGTDYQSTAPAASKPVEVQKAPVQQEEIVASEADDAPELVEVKKTETKPEKEKEKEEVKEVVPEVKPVPKPSKSTSDALSNLLKGGTGGGDGDDNVAGNKGKSNGDFNANGYNGGGGSGTGSGGGNGSGQGIGTGSGYGSGSGSGSGNGNGNYQLGNRKAKNKPQPNYVCNEEGIVVVQIWVDKTGKVIAANPGVRGTTNSTKCLLDQAKAAAKLTLWEPDEDAPEKQVGKIIYNFKLTE